jgi:hypothetical protein
MGGGGGNELMEYVRFPQCVGGAGRERRLVARKDA